jgi:hypothetical protein
MKPKTEIDRKFWRQSTILCKKQLNCQV